MKEYYLQIAGYNIRFVSKSDGPDLTPSGKFSKFISIKGDPDVIINVHSGLYDLPGGTQKVLDAPYFEETDGKIVQRFRSFWSVCKNQDILFIKSKFPHVKDTKPGILKFSLTSREWDLFLQDAAGADPMEYPLDGLLLYYLTVIHGDIMIHASGVSYRSKGYLFSGVSGKGKTTMAKLWDRYGARVIHDDRLILRNDHGKCVMYNTPVYNDEVPGNAPVSHIFLIEHGHSNKITRLKGAEAVTAMMANCIQHNWSPEIITRLIDSLAAVCNATEVYKLSFIPDNSVIETIINETGKD